MANVLTPRMVVELLNCAASLLDLAVESEKLTYKESDSVYDARARIKSVVRTIEARGGRQ